MPGLNPHPSSKSRTDVKTFHGKTACIETFVRPDGKTREWFLFEGKGKPCVVVFALTYDEAKRWMVVTVKHFRYGASEPIHELPGGGVDDNESNENAARRELTEETGYKVELLNVTLLGDPIWFEPAAIRAKFQPMLALDASATGSTKKDLDEFIDVELVQINKWFEMILLGQISDAKSVATSVRALKRLSPAIRAQITAFA